ncbi:MAG: hypothetical protein IPP52_16035 [Ignavibacteria bacterium]|nr:hypothetical protein [Ignavibacteria bacterium]
MENESFGIYKEELQEKTYLMNDGTMAPVFYRNVVNTGLKLKELSWVKNFIHKYKTELSKDTEIIIFTTALPSMNSAQGIMNPRLSLTLR